MRPRAAVALACAQVWRAVSREDDAVHALKVVFWGDPDVKEHHQKILKKEVQILRELDHPHVVRLLEAQDSPMCLILVLEYLKGGGLLEQLYEVEHYTEAQAAHLFRQILSAIAHMHERGIIHRDVKPENAVFAETLAGARAAKQEPTLKLVDFGLARHYSSQRSVKARLGSPGFMAPEVRALDSALDSARPAPSHAACPRMAGQGAQRG